jgi:hypothetical protein
MGLEKNVPQEKKFSEFAAECHQELVAYIPFVERMIWLALIAADLCA